MPFQTLGLSPVLALAAGELGFAAPTPIQAAAIPLVLRGVDVLASAPTGSGKTAAFALPLLERLQMELPGRGPGTGISRGPRRVRALVLVPTRELAAQVGEVIRSLGRLLPRPPKVAVVFGGVSINPQMMSLRGGVDVVVATPGRLLDLVDQNALRLSAVGLLVLDEADRLLDAGFAEELERVLALLPAQRQTLFFSATFPQPVQALALRLLRHPVRLDIPASRSAGSDTSDALNASGPPHASDASDASAGLDGSDGPAILQRAIQVDPGRRTELLRHLLKEHGWERALVFVATQYAADHVAWKLYKTGIFASPFHGGLSQGARTRVLSEFKAGQWDLLVTTDLAARGIDIEGLPVVVNYDLPRSAIQYLHRIGRTGRAGAGGLAVSFVATGTEAHFRLIEKRQHLSLPLEQLPGFEPVDVQPAALATIADGDGTAAGAGNVGTQGATGTTGAAGTGGIKGKRPSKKDKLRAAAARSL